MNNFLPLLDKHIGKEIMRIIKEEARYRRFWIDKTDHTDDLIQEALILYTEKQELFDKKDNSFFRMSVRNKMTDYVRHQKVIRKTEREINKVLRTAEKLNIMSHLIDESIKEFNKEIDKVIEDKDDVKRMSATEKVGNKKNVIRAIFKR